MEKDGKIYSFTDTKTDIQMILEIICHIVKGGDL